MKSNTFQPPFRSTRHQDINRGKPEINNTPIRQRDKENNRGQVNRNQMTPIQLLQRDSLGPSLQEQSVANSRTVPKRRPSLAPTTGCVNHPESQAQFRIQIEGDCLSYCGKCAAHLASNGFRVERITDKSPRRKEISRSPAFMKRRQELASFIESLKELEEGYMQKEEHIGRVQQSHQIQRETIGNFYSSLFEYLQYIRDQHFSFLDEEAKRSVQICQIQSDQIGQTLQELRQMRTDVESNVQKIVQEVDAASYRECMTFYTQKKGVHQHRLQELGNDARPGNCTSAECVQQKLSEFKCFIDELTGILSSKAESLHY